MKIRKNLSLSLLLLTLLHTLSNFHSCTAEVVLLDDTNFEHETQASTGMTTGSWLVFFKAQRCPHCAKLMPHYEKLSDDEELLERGIVLSALDVHSCPKVMNRFMIRGFPTILFLHKKRYYEYKGARDYESLKEFVLGGFEKEGSGYTAYTIPPPPSAVEYWIKLFQAVCLELRDCAMGKSGTAGYAIIVLVGALTSIFVFIFSMFLMPAKKVKKS